MKSKNATRVPLLMSTYICSASTGNIAFTFNQPLPKRYIYLISLCCSKRRKRGKMTKVLYYQSALVLCICYLKLTSLFHLRFHYLARSFCIHASTQTLGGQRFSADVILHLTCQWCPLSGLFPPHFCLPLCERAPGL